VIGAPVRSARTAYATAACAGLLGIGQARGQTPTPSANRTVNRNYVYAASLGVWRNSLAGLTAGVYALPLADTLPEFPYQGWPYQGWGLRLLMPVRAGIYSFRATDTAGIGVVFGGGLDVCSGSRRAADYPFPERPDGSGPDRAWRRSLCFPRTYDRRTTAGGRDPADRGEGNRGSQKTVKSEYQSNVIINDVK
jgi:hypothetical protein